MAASAGSVHGLLTRTLQVGARELLLVAAQDEFISPSKQFQPEIC